MSSGAHFHETDGKGETGQEPKTPEQQAEEVKQHVHRNRTKYQMLGAGLVGALLMRRYGKNHIHVEVPINEDPIKLVTSVNHLKALIDEPGSFLRWTHDGEPTITLIIEEHIQ